MTRLKSAALSPSGTSTASSHFVPRFAPQLARLFAASLLRGASGALAGLASRLAVQTHGVPEPRLATLEFYADAAAPEGALYADGYLVGWLEGVHRL